VHRARLEAVDVARGLALLGSAVATAVLWLHGRQLGPGFRPLEASGPDRVADTVTALLVDNRVLALFALLLGWSLTARHLRTGATGVDEVGDPRPWWLRRALLLLGLGALHAVLVLEADVLATLAVLLVLAVPLVGARAGVHVAVVVLVVPAVLISGLADGIGGTAGFPDPPADYLLSVLDRVGTWLLALVLLPFTQVGLLVSVVVGIRLARAGWLAEPGRHRRRLLLVGLVASVVGLAGNVPFARVVGTAGGQDVAVGALAGVLSTLTAPAAALGAVCLVVVGVDLLTAPEGPGLPAGRPLPSPLAGLALLGRNGLGVYLAHSAVLALVLAPWAAGWGGRWGSSGVVALACGLWLVTFVVATARASRPGRGRALPGPQPIERQGLERSSAT
jgi:uncharacterized protein